MVDWATASLLLCTQGGHEAGSGAVAATLRGRALPCMHSTHTLYAHAQRGSIAGSLGG
jgi:hypothetical protein